MSKTVVIGFDGANWPLINSITDHTTLPTLQRLKANGSWGVSESHLPPVTCPNWKCYATGKNPGQLGVYWWERIDVDSRSMDLPDATDFTSPELWDYLNDTGHSAGVINLPMSYPPRQINEFMIAGGPRSRETGYTDPPELESTLENRFNYKVHPDNVLTSNKDSEDAVRHVHELLRTRLRTARALFEERDLDFLHVTLFHLNVLQHYFWDGPETRRAYEIIDDELEQFLDDDVNLLLMSDHGCTQIDTVFYINAWLADEGYLTTTESITSRLHDFGVTQERVAGLARNLGVEKYIRPMIPRRIIERFPSDEGVVREEKLRLVDWDRTDAIGSGQGLIYINANTATERDDIRSSLMADLEAATGLDGRPIAREVYRREDLYTGARVELAPDIVFDQRPGVHTSEAMGQDEPMAPPDNWRAENVPSGLFLFHGTGIDSKPAKPMRISDLAPTLLHWMGQSVPTDMDGAVQREVFDNESKFATGPVNYRKPLAARGTDTASLEDSVEDRLEDIGYLE